MSYYLFTGLVLGLTAGISPGPLQTLLISETLRYSRKAGIRIAIAPLLTDLPIILLAVLIIQQFAGMNMIMGIIAMTGAVYLLYLAYGSFKYKQKETQFEPQASQSLGKGMVANFLNPHPYLFWMTIGAPTILAAYKIHFTITILFVLGFYTALIGSLVLTAILVSKSKIFIKQKVYVIIIRILGIVLIILAILFIREAITFFK